MSICTYHRQLNKILCHYFLSLNSTFSSSTVGTVSFNLHMTPPAQLDLCLRLLFASRLLSILAIGMFVVLFTAHPVVFILAVFLQNFYRFIPPDLLLIFLDPILKRITTVETRIIHYSIQNVQYVLV